MTVTVDEPLDALDRAILRSLQTDGRLTNVELAKRVRLSPSPCLRRAKSLEARGYIRGDTALLGRGRRGARARLSPSPCRRRVKSLEDRGYIRGYTALLDRARVGRGLHVVVMVSLTSQRQETLEAFEQSVAALDDVLECYLMAGESDYLL